jgi:hypothetical protein
MHTDIPILSEMTVQEIFRVRNSLISRRRLVAAGK